MVHSWCVMSECQFSDVCRGGFRPTTPLPVMGGGGGTSHAGTMPAGMESVYIKGWHSVRKEYYKYQ